MRSSHIIYILRLTLKFWPIWIPFLGQIKEAFLVENVSRHGRPTTHICYRETRKFRSSTAYHYFKWHWLDHLISFCHTVLRSYNSKVQFFWKCHKNLEKKIYLLFWQISWFTKVSVNFVVRSYEGKKLNALGYRNVAP